MAKRKLEDSSAISEKHTRLDGDLEQTEQIRQVIVEMCAEFYRQGQAGDYVHGNDWAKAKNQGGGMSCRTDNQILVTPSGVMKEKMKIEDLFALDTSTHQVVFSPANLKQSDSTSVFLAIHKARNAGCVIHTHSQNAVMASRLWPRSPIRIENQEMMKGVRRSGLGQAYGNADLLEIPIIDNMPTERDLTEPITEALALYPEAPCVLIRNHGVYLFGETWQKTKIQAECLDYLFEIMVKLRLAGHE